MPTERSGQLGDLARRVADAVPVEIAEEVVLTGSVSRGVADEVSDIELLIVTNEQLSLEACLDLARGAGLTGLDTWGAQAGLARRVFGFRDGVPVELIWWSRTHAEASIDALLRGEASSAADALVHGLPLRATGLLDRWQARLGDYPEELAAAAIED